MSDFLARIDLLLIITIWLWVVLCPLVFCAEFCQSGWYTNLILATWLDQPSLFLRWPSKLSLWRQYGICSKWVHAENYVAIISSNECAYEAHREPVSSMLITWREEDLTCPVSCSRTQLPDASVSGLMTDRPMLMSFNVADVNIVDNCITAMVLWAWAAS